MKNTRPWPWSLSFYFQDKYVYIYLSTPHTSWWSGTKLSTRIYLPFVRKCNKVKYNTLCNPLSNLHVADILYYIIVKFPLYVYLHDRGICGCSRVYLLMASVPIVHSVNFILCQSGSLFRTGHLFEIKARYCCLIA